MRIGSLFTGVGGLDIAVQDVFGGRHAWMSEIDPAASKVLAHRFPGVQNLGSVTDIDWATVPAVDVLCGGWPCQPFSLAGKRKGINDERALWPYVAGAVRALRPRWVVLENVSAVLTAGEFDRVAADLAACGYDLRWTCARASDVGAPHRRERLFVVAHSWCDGWDEGRPESARLAGGFDAAVGGDEVVRQLGADEPGVALLPTPRSSDCFGAGHHGDGGMDLRTTVTERADTTAWGKYAPAIARWEQVTGQPAPPPTEPNKNGNPRLSAAFSEWLMGWPAGWVTDPAIGISRNDQLRCVGNGVVSLQAAAAIRYLMEVRA